MTYEELFMQLAELDCGIAWPPSMVATLQSEIKQRAVATYHAIEQAAIADGMLKPGQ